MFFKKSLVAALLLPALGVFAEEVRWPVPPSGYSQASNNIPKGKVEKSLNYPTRNLGQRKYSIYLPPGYSATRAEKYPVLYLHHGIGGNEMAWTSSEGNADRVMDYLYAQANLNVTPMIVVMPMGNMTGSNGDAWQNFEDVLKGDLIPYIESTYHASSNPVQRAIAGLSMGGGQTLNFGYKNPTVFNWIGSFSPAPNTIAANQTIKDMAAVKANVKLNFLAAGTDESMFLNTARNYHNYLDDNDVSNLYLQIEQGQGHAPENWNRQLHNFAQRIFKGVPTAVAFAPRSAVDRAGNGAESSRFLVSRRGEGMSIRLFTLDGRTVPSRVPALLPGAPSQP